MKDNGSVVVTGRGMITGQGGLSETWQAVLDGRVRAVPTGAAVGEAARYPVVEIGDSRLESLAQESTVPLDRTAVLALLAARDAIKDAGLESRPDVLSAAGVIVGTARSTEWTRRAHFEMERVGAPLPKTACLSSMFASPSQSVAARFGLRGPNLSVSVSCVSSFQAMMVAAAYLGSGAADVVLAGGAESCLTPEYVRQLGALGILTEASCRPFDRDRSGTWLGEGAGFLVLESPSHARERGAEIAAELIGFGTVFDGSLKAKRPTLAEAMRQALDDARVDVEELGFINAHAPGTQVGDAVEGRAIKRLARDHAERIQVNSLKPVIGHCIGASTVIETALCIEALHAGVFPATANLQNVDAAFGFSVPSEPQPLDSPMVLKTTSGLGGVHAACLMRRSRSGDSPSSEAVSSPAGGRA